VRFTHLRPCTVFFGCRGVTLGGGVRGFAGRAFCHRPGRFHSRDMAIVRSELRTRLGSPMGPSCQKIDVHGAALDIERATRIQSAGAQNESFRPQPTEFLESRSLRGYHVGHATNVAGLLRVGRVVRTTDQELAKHWITWLVVWSRVFLSATEPARSSISASYAPGMFASIFDFLPGSSC